LDKAAAARFINAALASEFGAEQARSPIIGPTNSPPTTFIPHHRDTIEVASIGGGVHTRFAHVEKDDASTSGSDDQDIAVFTEIPELQGSHAVQYPATGGVEKRMWSSLDPFVGNSLLAFTPKHIQVIR